MSVQQVLILLWKYLLVKEEELLYGWKVSKFRLAALFANARRVDASKLRVENTAILRLQPRKLILLLFWKIKGFLREHLTSDYLSTLKLFMDKKWRKSIFQLLPLDGRNFLTVALKSVEFRENVGSFPIDKGNCNNIIRVKWVSVKRGFQKCTVSGKDRGYRIVGIFGIYFMVESHKCTGNIHSV